MQKTSNLHFYFFVSLLVFYQILQSIFVYLPPLLGVFFTTFCMLCYKKKYNKMFIFCILYLCFIELSNGFYLFSSILSALFFYFFIFTKIIYKIKMRALVVIICNICAYLFSYIINIFLFYIFGAYVLELNFIISYYVGIEILLSLIAFKDEL